MITGTQTKSKDWWYSSLETWVSFVCLLLHLASQALDIDRYAPEIQLQPLILTPDLDLKASIYGQWSMLYLENLEYLENSWQLVGKPRKPRKPIRTVHVGNNHKHTHAEWCMQHHCLVKKMKVKQTIDPVFVRPMASKSVAFFILWIPHFYWTQK